jgi:signal transduction histidine kinase
MGNNLITNLATCMPLTLETFGGSLGLLYYSHIPTAIISLFLGLYVLIKGRKGVLSKVFFALTLMFVVWSILDLFTWLSPDSRVIMFTWSLTGLVETFFFVFSFYFVYLFAEKKDIPLGYKMIGGIILLPLILMIPTKFNLTAFNIDQCYSLENNYSLYYKYFVEILFSLIILLYSLVKIKKEKVDKYFKKQLIILLVGVSLFLLSFFSAIFLSGYLADNGWNMFGYKFEMYGLFGTVIFMGFLSYLIVQYKAFKIELIRSQALVGALVVLIGALFFYVQENGGRILIAINVLLALIFGRLLVKSVKAEIQKSEELEIANKEISERKDQLQVMSDSLAISNDKLKVANDKLQELDQAKSDFFARAAHDLRNPLTSIKGFTSLLEEGSYGQVNEEQKGVLGKVLGVSERMMGLVEDFLTASKLETGGMQYNFAKCKVEIICQDIVDMLFPKAKDKGLYLDFKKPEENLPEPTVDASRIMESVSNLVDNAVKYTEKGGVTIKLEQDDHSEYKRPLSTSNEEKAEENIEGPVLRITVADTGMGIPKDGIHYLFAKYSRGKGEARTKTKGTGLGLYVGKCMIEDNGGKVWAESDGEGLGSRFIVELPVNPPKKVLDKIAEAEKLK